MLIDSDNDNICALQTDAYAGGSHCGKWVTIRNTDTGAQTAVSSNFNCHTSLLTPEFLNADCQCMVADSCPSCGSYSDIDLSRKVFGQLTNWDYGQGVVNVEWFFQ